MPKLKFTKMQATGNDFILIDARRIERDWSKLAIAMCDRHFGIGADGLLLVLLSSVAHFSMRMFNHDGSEAEMCGNGLRCFARYVIENRLAKSQQLRVETMSGIRKVELQVDKGRVSQVRVSMGMPRFKAEDMPLLKEEGRGTALDITPILYYPLDVGQRQLSLSFISMGNPHAVCFLEESVDDFPLAEVGPRVEYHSLFPQRVNLEVANIIDRGRVKARVWERGVGETLSCGSGACAIAVAAQLCGHVDSKIDIVLPGGVLSIEWDRKKEVMLTGPVELAFTGEWTGEK